jgi:hypothetical protein
MRNVFTLLLVVCIAGCGVEVLTTTAIQGELQKQQLEALKRQTSYAGDTTAKVRLEQAIGVYQAEKGSYPPSLEALVPTYIESLPYQSSGEVFGYDPATGKLLTGSPAAITADQTRRTDDENLALLQEAINKYGRDTGYYPPTLSALEPLYLDPLPVAASGAPYNYDAQTGQVWAPGLSPQQQAYTPPAPQPSRAPGVSGAGPMGEAMTGIAIQNDLNSMNQSGTSAAGSRMRQQAASVEGEYQQKQDQALQELDY